MSMKTQGFGATAIAKALGIGRPSAYRVLEARMASRVGAADAGRWNPSPAIRVEADAANEMDAATWAYRRSS
jgi:hypothetical protein